ncbi:MAG TPA: ATP-binding cassette domain-containing protein [Streptosporangiaceae bacterium]|nr:ATP-binding cassette domain-containing protein [Streptosporangiaceae bacterium]
MWAVRSPRQTVRRTALRVLVRAFPVWTATLAVLAALTGALPAVFAALVGRLVGQVPAVVRAGFRSAAGGHLTGTLAAMAAVLAVLELVSAAQAILAADLYRRFDGYLLGRVMTAALSGEDLRLFDEPDRAAALDRAMQAARYGPGELVSGLSSQWTARAQGLAAAFLVGFYWPVAAAGLTLLWLAVARAVQTSYYEASPFWADPLRRARYLKDIGLLPHWAKELRIFGLVGWLAEEYSREWAQVMGWLWQARRAGRGKMAVLGCVVLAAHLAVLTLLASAVSSGALDAAGATIVVQGLIGMAMIANQLGDVWIENGAVPIPDVLALERLAPPGAAGNPSAADNGAGRADAAGLPRNAITFSAVSFRYPAGDADVLSGLSLRIEAGTSLAIVGLNGAGKTTLVKLLCGLCHPTAGAITVDGIPLASLDQASWRRQLAVVFQDFVRYELPLRDNISFAAIDQPADDTAVSQAAALAGAGDLVAALPSGLDTTLSPRFEGGVGLSGGQWQRIAFARALRAVRAGASVLVMDEPTAHLDVRAEAQMYERFLELTRGLTSVVISHRFSTVRRADRIVVVEHGAITEDGSHDELVAAGGEYARLFRLQASSYRASGAADE